MGERKRKKQHVGGKKKRKKIRAFATPETRTLALHAFPALNTEVRKACMCLECCNAELGQ